MIIKLRIEAPNDKGNLLGCYLRSILMEHFVGVQMPIVVSKTFPNRWNDGRERVYLEFECDDVAIAPELDNVIPF